MKSLKKIKLKSIDLNPFSRLPLKIKVILLFVILTTGMLAVYASLALNDFKSDKIAYVFDTSTSHSKAVGTQVRADLDFAIDKIGFYMRDYNFETKDFTTMAKKMFREEKYLSNIWTYHKDPNISRYINSAALDSREAKSNVPSLRQNANRLISESIKSKFSMRKDSIEQGKWFVSVRFDGQNKDEYIVAIAQVNKGSFLDFFTSSQIQDNYLVRSAADVIIDPKEKTYELEHKLLLGMTRELSVLSKESDSWTKEAKDEEGEAWLVSKVAIGIGDLSVVSFVPKAAALEAASFLFIKSIIFFILLVSISISISIIAGNKLTVALRELLSATKNIGQGDFDIQVKVTSKDEFGGLADGFNHMAKEIKRLLRETEEKARMESELETAKLVQSTLFPNNHFENENIEIIGHYEPASECGGDWWSYSEIGDRVFVWIGDATGHGVPAALITSAAKSASKVLEHFPDLPINELMALMNSAIHSAAKGEVLMTFFLGCYDKNTLKMTYCNASHDPPYLFRKVEGKVSKKHIITLNDEIGPRLGESEDSQYQACEIQLEAGDRLVFYTDGVTELKGANGEDFGERKFLRSLIKSFNSKDGIELALANLGSDLEEFKQDTPLADDVTYFAFQCKAS